MDFNILDLTFGFYTESVLHVLIAIHIFRANVNYKGVKVLLAALVISAASLTLKMHSSSILMSMSVTVLTMTTVMHLFFRLNFRKALIGSVISIFVVTSAEGILATVSEYLTVTLIAFANSKQVDISALFITIVTLPTRLFQVAVLLLLMRSERDYGSVPIMKFRWRDLDRAQKKIVTMILVCILSGHILINGYMDILRIIADKGIELTIFFNYLFLLQISIVLFTYLVSTLLHRTAESELNAEAVRVYQTIDRLNKEKGEEENEKVI